MIAYSLLAADGAWSLFVTTDEGDDFSEIRTSLLFSHPTREGAFKRMMQALAAKPGDYYISNPHAEELAKLRHPHLMAGSLLPTAPDGVRTFLALREMLRNA